MSKEYVIKEVIFGSPVKIFKELLPSFNAQRANGISCVKKEGEFHFSHKDFEDIVVIGKENVKSHLLCEKVVDMESSAHLNKDVTGEKPRTKKAPKITEGQ